jgi:hypothetical protein
MMAKVQVREYREMRQKLATEIVINGSEPSNDAEAGACWSGPRQLLFLVFA